MIKTFDRQTIKTIRARIEEALDAVSEELGVSVEVGNCSFADRTATLKVELTTANQDGVHESKGEIDFALHCRRFGLSPEDMGKVFSSKGKIFHICGLKPTSPATRSS